MFNEIEKSKTDNPTIGILLCAETDNVVVKYSVLDDKINLFASKYQLYLPILPTEWKDKFYLNHFEESVLEKSQIDLLNY